MLLNIPKNGPETAHTRTEDSRIEKTEMKNSERSKNPDSSCYSNNKRGTTSQPAGLKRGESGSSRKVKHRRLSRAHSVHPI